MLNISADYEIFFPIRCTMHDRIIRTVPGAEGYSENQVSESGMVWLPGALGGPVADAGKAAAALTDGQACLSWQEYPFCMEKTVFAL